MKRETATMRNLYILAGRGPLRDLTEFINHRLFAELALCPDDQFVDVGWRERACLAAGVGEWSQDRRWG